MAIFNYASTSPFIAYAQSEHKFFENNFAQIDFSSSVYYGGAGSYFVNLVLPPLETKKQRRNAAW